MEKLFWRFSFSELWRMSDCYFRLYRCVWKSTKNKLLIELAVWEESEKARVVCVWNFSIPSTLCKARVVLVAGTDRGWWEERGGGELNQAVAGGGGGLDEFSDMTPGQPEPVSHRSRLSTSSTGPGQSLTAHQLTIVKMVRSKVQFIMRPSY